MLHFFIFYSIFYATTRFRFAYPKKNKDADERDDVIAWFAIWPFALEMLIIAWLGFEFYDQVNGEKTIEEE